MRFFDGDERVLCHLLDGVRDVLSSCILSRRYLRLFNCAFFASFCLFKSECNRNVTAGAFYERKKKMILTHGCMKTNVVVRSNRRQAHRLRMATPEVERQGIVIVVLQHLEI